MKEWEPGEYEKAMEYSLLAQRANVSLSLKDYKANPTKYYRAALRSDLEDARFVLGSLREYRKGGFQQMFNFQCEFDWKWNRHWRRYHAWRKNG